MATTRQIFLALAAGVALSATSCGQRTITGAVARAEKVVLYEGLPHQMFEAAVLEEERRTKLVQELNGYPFYQEPMRLPVEDATRLKEILGKTATYKPFAGEKKCGGFHPDYAVEFHVGADRYRALICFGCREVKLFGPGLDSRHDLEDDAYRGLEQLLAEYRQNRPASKH